MSDVCVFIVKKNTPTIGGQIETLPPEGSGALTMGQNLAKSKKSVGSNPTGSKQH